MKRLKKKAVMDKRTFNALIDNLTINGKNLLKDISAYKFHLEQINRIFENDIDLKQKIGLNFNIIDDIEKIIQNIIISFENINKEEYYEKFKNNSL